MCDLDIENVLATYEKNGFVSPVRLISEQDAIHHRGLLEEAETSFGNMHYRSKIHTIHTSPLESGCMRIIPHSHLGRANGTCYDR